MIENQPLVSVFMMTYNHEAFIRQALDGVLMQKTTFDFDIVVGEDCSTDKTRDILLEYQQKHPEKFKLLLHEKNIGAMANQMAVLHACTGKYIAVCEGDDYWTDPYKLQKQVDFLEANPEYGLTCSDYNLLNQNSGLTEINNLKKKYNFSKDKDISILEYLGNRQHIITLTAVLKRNIILEYYKEIPFEISTNFAAGDVPLWLYILANYKVRYLSMATGVYRVSENTASRLSDIDKKHLWQMEVYRIFDYYINRYKLGKQVKRTFAINKLLIKMEYHSKKHDAYQTFNCFLSLLFLRKINKRMVVNLIESTIKKPKII